MINPGEMALAARKGTLGVVYLRAVAAIAGYATAVPEPDNDSVDLIVSSRTGRSQKLDFQVKCTSNPAIDVGHIAYDLPVKNYNDLRKPTCSPRYLLVVVVPEPIERWLTLNERRGVFRNCGYFVSLQGKGDTDNSATVTVRLPRSNILDAHALRGLMMEAELSHAG